MRQTSLMIVVVLLVAVPTLYADDSCGGLIAGGVFDTYSAQSAQVSASQFHQAMCSSELHAVGSSSNQSAGLSIGGFEIDLGMSMAAASQFQSQYRSEFCRQNDSSSVSQASLNAFRSVVSRDLVDAYNDCRRATAKGLQPEVHVLGDDSIAIDLTYTGAATPKVSTITVRPAEHVTCTGKLIEGAELSTKTIGTLCSRAADYHGKVLVTVETTEGRISKSLPPEPRPATEAELLKLAFARLARTEIGPDGSGYLRVGSTLVCWGQLSVPAGRTPSFNFAFSAPFRTPPVVTTALIGQNSGYTYGIYQHRVTADGFEGTALEAQNRNAENQPLIVSYVAFGQAR